MICICIPVSVWSQDSVATKKWVPASTNSAAVQLRNSLEKNRSNEEIANDYMGLANRLVAQNDYTRAENYLLQAINLYQRSKNRERQALAYRELAKLKENQKEFDEAIKNYQLASRTSEQKEVSEINLNDANRLKNRDNVINQASFIQRNIKLSEATRNTSDAVMARQQMAQVMLEMDDSEAAIGELQNALDIVKDQPEQSIKIKEEIAKVYVAEEKYDEALAVNHSLVNEARKASNPTVEINQLQNLSNTYFEAREKEKGIASLKDAYDVAIRNGRTMEARGILEQMTSYYRESKKPTDALNMYADFVGRLDTLIKGDSTLIDEKYFQVHEDKIAQLEKERVLKDELIARKNLSNYALTAFLSISLLLVLLIARALYSINKKNKRIALQSLRREMNPHFIFNSLNSVNQFIAQNNELEANKYLTSYSRLMRNIMENSNKDFITLTTEIDQMRRYLELEHLRFNDKFEYEIIVDSSLDTDAVFIPNMLIQPQLENAIWHGLRYKEDMGRLSLNIQVVENRLRVIVEDNGIGLQQSAELKTRHQKQHNSRGLSNTRERIELLNKLYRLNISMEIINKEDGETGVIVTLSFPLIEKNFATNEQHLAENKKRHN